MSAWNFAAAAQTIGELPHSLKNSREYEVERNHQDDEETKARMKAASQAAVDLVATGLWGSGPFSVALSGTNTLVYLSVTNR